MNSELSSRSSIQSLRQLQNINYKKMNDGEDQTQWGSDKMSTEILDDVGVGSFDDNPLGAPVQVQGHLNRCKGKF